MHIVDSLDFITNTTELMYAADEIKLQKWKHNTNNVHPYIDFTYDVSKNSFCKFVNECSITVRKYGFAKHICKKSYIYIEKHLNRIEKQQSILHNPFVAILTNDRLIHPLFFQSALNSKIIYTENAYIKNTFNYTNVVFSKNAVDFCRNYHTELQTIKLKYAIKKSHLYSHRIYHILKEFSQTNI